MLSFYAKIVTRVFFFYGREINFILSVVPNLQPIKFEKGELIYKDKDYAEEGLFFVIFLIRIII